MATADEQNAAFHAVKPHILSLVPGMFQGYITDNLVHSLCNDALRAAEQVRDKASATKK